MSNRARRRQRGPSSSLETLRARHWGRSARERMALDRAPPRRRPRRLRRSSTGTQTRSWISTVARPRKQPLRRPPRLGPAAAARRHHVHVPPVRRPPRPAVVGGTVAHHVALGAFRIQSAAKRSVRGLVARALAHRPPDRATAARDPRRCPRAESPVTRRLSSTSRRPGSSRPRLPSRARYRTRRGIFGQKIPPNRK